MNPTTNELKSGYAGKVAVIHDWLNGMRGGEKVLEEILRIFPGADVFTLFLEPEHVSDIILAHRIIASPLNRSRFIRKHYKHFLPLLPAAAEAFDLSGYDLVISSSHCVAKGVVPHPGALHVSYLHSPMRYIWDQYPSYFGHTKGLKKWFIQSLVSRLRTWDTISSARVDRFIANSTFVRERIRRYYRRDAEVIHPPADTEFFQPTPNPRRDYFLTVSALVPYKEIQLLIETFNKTGDRLIVVGKGPEEGRLKRLAGTAITFKKNIGAEELRDLYANAAAFVFAGVEDFGIAFVEAQACGVPVLAYKKGGVLDIVQENTGVLFDQQTPESLAEGLKKIKKNPPDSSIIRQNSLQFSREAFRLKFKQFCEGLLAEERPSLSLSRSSAFPEDLSR